MLASGVCCMDALLAFLESKGSNKQVAARERTQREGVWNALHGIVKKERRSKDALASRETARAERQAASEATGETSTN